MTNVRWRIIAMLLVAATINYIDRVNLSYAAPTLMKEFGVGPAQMGFVLSAFLWTYFLLQVPVGLALDKFGVRFVYGGAAFLWGAATMLTATATGVVSLAAWRTLLGVGEAPLAPAGTKVIGVWAADHERGFASAMTVAGVPLGVFIGSPFIGWLLADFGWQTVFVGTGAIAVLWSLGWMAYYRQPEQHRGANDAERSYLRSNSKRESMPTHASWRSLLTNRNILGLSLGHATLLFNLYFLLTWLPTYLIEQHHLTTLRTGLFGSIPWFFGLVGALLGGRLSDILVRRGWPIMRARKAFLGLGMILGMTSLLSLFTVTVTATVACLSVAVFGLLITNSVVWAANAEIAPTQQGAQVSAIQNCVGNAAGLLAPIMVGVLLQLTGSWMAPMVSAAVIALAGAAVYTLMLSDDAMLKQPTAAIPDVRSASLAR
ncbi:MAG: transporter, family, D-galactonate transporter [Acetobacteraceae bacterium]|nr:transporter, family, D-galactonate transporter [Acetobacteraceae bacterium]